MDRKSFILYQSYEEQINCLSNEEKGILLSAIFEYSRTQNISQELPFGANLVFLGIRAGLDRDHEKYTKICERNKENAKRAGRPKKIQSISEKSHNDNDNENGNGNENKNDNDIDNGNGIGNGNGNDIAQANAPLDNAPHSSAPTALRETPSLKEEEKEELILKGIPEEYISEREERASEFARKTKRSTYSVIVEWWESDKRGSKWNNGRASPVSSLPSSHERSYDIDDFFAASLRRSYEEFDEKYGVD